MDRKKNRLILLLLLTAGTGSAWGEGTPTPTSAPLTTLQGTVCYLGDSILDGQDLGSNDKGYSDLFTRWLNEHYGPVTEIKYGDCVYTSQLNDQIENKLAGVTMTLCVLEMGMRNLEFRVGGPNESVCGGCTTRAGLLASFHYGADLQGILSAVRDHLVPGGILLMTNLYEVNDCTQDHFEDWEDYPKVLRAYDRITAMAAGVNNAKLVDLFSLMAAHPSYMGSCTPYPNTAGHAAIAALLEKAVKETVPFPPQPKDPAAK